MRYWFKFDIVAEEASEDAKVFKGVIMSETRGAASIVDRVEGWGHTAGSVAARKDNATWGSASGNTVTATDSSKEATATRVARTRSARKSFKETNDPAIVDRDQTSQHYTDYANSYKKGVFLDKDGSAETGTGSNTANTTSDTDALAAGRTADSRNTVLLNDANSTRRAAAVKTSIVDRGFIAGVQTISVDAWGHSDGSLPYRNNADS